MAIRRTLNDFSECSQELVAFVLRLLAKAGNGAPQTDSCQLQIISTCASALLSICYDFAKCRKFHGFFRGGFLEKINTAFQTERQSCFRMQNARFQNWLAAV